MSSQGFPSFVSPRASPAPEQGGDQAAGPHGDRRQFEFPPVVTPMPVSVTSSPVPVTTPPAPAAGLPDALPEVECVVRARIPTTTGAEMFLHLYTNNLDNKEHLAIVFGNHVRSKSLDRVREGETEMDRMIRGAYVGRLYPGRQTSTSDSAAAEEEQERQRKATLVRIHSECYTGETAWSARCDCGEQLDEAARVMAEEGNGVVVYLRQEGRGIGLGEKLKAYNLQDLGADTVTANLMLRHPADARTYSLATAILVDLGQSEIRLLTNNPDKIAAVEGKHHEVQVLERVPMVPIAWRENGGGIRSKEVEGYLRTKIERMGHMLDRP
ncbi:GTP cyclohydrolase II-domain-containing protein [Dipodascopsis tothii]|uniref:GTP cyclohydrolase II-domain-containing protein n=1 Tax=Dipodascopsis tothii TaxID=44089 RepID=UPI0034D00B89